MRLDDERIPDPIILEICSSGDGSRESIRPVTNDDLTSVRGVGEQKTSLDEPAGAVCLEDRDLLVLSFALAMGALDRLVGPGIENTLNVGQYIFGLERQQSPRSILEVNLAAFESKLEAYPSEWAEAQKQKGFASSLQGCSERLFERLAVDTPPDRDDLMQNEFAAQAIYGQQARGSRSWVYLHFGRAVFTKRSAPVRADR